MREYRETYRNKNVSFTLHRVVECGPFLHIDGMLDVMRERESIPNRVLSSLEFRAVVESFDVPIAKTPLNVLSLMLAIGTGRFPRLVFAYEP